MEKIKGLYILEGKKSVPATDPVEWAKWMLQADRHVGKTSKGKVSVSTVFMAADLSAAFSGRAPILFETRVFGGPFDGTAERHRTWEEAEEGHKGMCKRVFLGAEVTNG